MKKICNFLIFVYIIYTGQAKRGACRCPQSTNWCGNTQQKLSVLLLFFVVVHVGNDNKYDN